MASRNLAKFCRARGLYARLRAPFHLGVYRKKTHTDRYLHFESHHLIHVKKGTVRCLYDQARNLMQRNESLNEEENHLMKTFIGNGYPRAFVRSASKQRTPREPDEDDGNETEKPPIAYFPYVAGLFVRG